MTKLPNFKLSLIDGNEFDSSSIKSKTILFFYPKFMTSGCTVEVNDFNDNLESFKKLKFTIIGCSKDSIEENLRFFNKYQLKYNLACDLTNACEKLNIWVEKSMYGKKYFGIERSTFMLDSYGNVFRKWNNVKVKDHVNEVLEIAKSCK